VSYVAFIPLRGGSKGIPGKNIKPIAGKPLCRWTIEAAAGAARIDRVYVATDSQEITNVVRSFGIDKVEVVGRGAATATDTASTESAMLEFAEQRDFGHMVLIQATSPLLSSRDLDEAIAKFEREGADSLVTVVEQKRFTWTLSDGRAVPTNYDPLRRPRRQDFSPYYVENGAFYISERSGLLRHQCRLFGRMAAHVMAEETFHEIDEPVDWKIIEAFLEERSRARDTASFAERARRIKLVLTDVDGVLTDSGMYYSENGDELKKFNTRDGKAFELLRNAGIQGGIITSEDTKLVERRAKKLKLDFLIQGAKDKVPALERVMAQTGYSAEEIAFVGDDLADVPLLARVGLGACPRDAVPEARKAAFYVCGQRGGEGCVREVAERILVARSSIHRP
jgi:N-acylneuraminate cytidylyltransferase